MMIEKIGEISLEVIEVLKLPLKERTPIYLGTSNKAHMLKYHNYEFNKFYEEIPHIILTADYVRLKEDDGSVEYIKSLGKYLKIAVRVAGDGNYYARSLYFIETDRVENLIKNGELKPLTNNKLLSII